MPYGSDISAVSDINPSMVLRSGPQVLADAIGRRLITPRGGLFYDPDYGLDVRAWLNESITESSGVELGSAIAAECEKDERIESARATVDFNLLEGRIRIAVELTTAEGPYRLVLSVSDVSVDILEADAS